MTCTIVNFFDVLIVDVSGRFKQGESKQTRFIYGRERVADGREVSKLSCQIRVPISVEESAAVVWVKALCLFDLLST